MPSTRILWRRDTASGATSSSRGTSSRQAAWCSCAGGCFARITARRSTPTRGRAMLTACCTCRAVWPTRWYRRWGSRRAPESASASAGPTPAIRRLSALPPRARTPRRTQRRPRRRGRARVRAALALDPAYARAHVGLVLTLTHQAWLGAVRGIDVMEPARHAALEALAHDDCRRRTFAPWRATMTTCGCCERRGCFSSDMMRSTRRSS